MNLRKHITMGLALAGLAIGLTTAQAKAESILKGTFELPASAYWGDTFLQPGQYTFWMTTEVRDLSRVPVIHLRGEGINVAFLTIAKPAKETGRTFLDIANIEGTYVIRALDAGTLGESFAFGVTRSVKNKALRASAEPVAIALPVSAE